MFNQSHLNDALFNFFENANVGMAFIGLNGEWLKFNKKVLEITEYSESELQKLTFYDITHPEDLGFDLHYLEQINKNLIQSYQIEKRYISKSKKIKYIELNVNVVRDKDNSPLYYLSQIKDITLFKNLKRESALNHSKYISIIESISDGFWDWDLVSNKVFYSKNYWEVFGYDKNNAPESWTDIIFKEDLIIANEKIDLHLKSKGVVPYELEVRYRHKSGETVWVICKGKVIEWGSDGKPLRMLGIHTDITEIKKQQIYLEKIEKQEFYKKEHWFRTIANKMPQLFWTCLPTGECDYLSDQWISYTGIPESKQLGYGWLEQLHPDDRQETLNTWEIATREKTTTDMFFRIRNFHGEYRWFHTKAVPLLNESGELTKWLGSNTDIHEFKIIQEDLLQKERDLNQAQAIANMGSWQFDLKTEKIKVSDNFYKIFGLPFGSSTKELSIIYESMLETDKQRIKNKIENLIKSGTSFKELFVYKGPNDNQERWIETQIECVKENNLIRVIYGIVKDVTENKKNMEIMQKARLDAESATRAKANFLSNMSHEIRTPINGVLGMTQLLKLTDLNSKQKDFVDIISNSSNHLLKIINDILDLSKIEVSEFTLFQEVNNIENIVVEVLEYFKYQLHIKNIKIDLILDSKIKKLNVLVDTKRLRQVLINLISNAIKFSFENSKVKVLIEKQRLNSHQVRIKFSVEDSGIGIEKTKLAHLFEPFFQIENPQLTNIQGTGLGLSICKTIVERLGGKIACESQLNKGSCFWFELDFEVTTFQFDKNIDLFEQENKGSLNLNVLLCEDHEVNKIVTEAYLEQLGCHFTSLNSGENIIETLMQNHFDLVLMDCQMPKVNGFEATELIRTSNYENIQNIPIIALTASASEENKQNCLNLRMNGFLPKPFTIHDLQRELKKYTEKSIAEIQI